MANSYVGTATNFEDLFTKIVDFVTTDSVLVAAGEAWDVVHQVRDNLAGLTTNVTNAGTGVTRQLIHTARADPRSLNINTLVTAAQGDFTAAGIALGASQWRYQLRTTKAVATVRMRASIVTPSNMLRTFRLQYSDNDSTWTTALTVTLTPAFTTGEWRDFAVPGTPGSHVYWRIIVDALQSGSTTMQFQSCMLLDAGGVCVNQFGSEVIFKAPGLAGTDEIYTGIRTEYDTTNGWYNLFLNGYTGYDPLERSWLRQPGCLPGYDAGIPMRCIPMIPCWNAAMPVWLAASGRSLRIGIKVSTNYETGYLGFMYPYAQPDQYPYPLVVAGSLAVNDAARGAEWRYSTTHERHGSVAGPGSAHNNAVTDVTDQFTSMYVREVSGLWLGYTNRPATSGSSESVARPDQGTTAPYTPTGLVRGVWPHCQNAITNIDSKGRYPYRECLGGGYMLQGCILLERLPSLGALGELEGVYAISGFGQTAENTGVFGGRDYVVLQNAYRNSLFEFSAMDLP